MNENGPPKRQQASKAFSFLLLAAILLLISAALVSFVSQRWADAFAIRELEEKARKNGEPLTYAELAAMYPPIPDNQNGAALLMDQWEKYDHEYWKMFRAGILLHREPAGAPDRDPILPYIGSSSALVRRTNDIDPLALQAADDYLQEQREHLDQVRAALRSSQFWFPIRITDGREILLPHLAVIKFEALNFSMEALLASERGDQNLAITAIENTARMGNVLRSEPNTVSQGVRLACYGIALRDMERLLSRHSLTDAQLARLTDFLDTLQTPGALRLTILENRVFCLNGFAIWDRVPFSKAIASVQKDKRLILTECDRLTPLGDPDNPEALQVYEAICTNAAAKSLTISSSTLSSTLFVSFVPGSVSKFASFEARRRAAITALAVERYRISHQGQFPSHLSDITPQFLHELPSDPYDGKPIRFKPLQTGFVTYSVGRDGVDDGGMEIRTNINCDLTFFIER